MDLDVVPIARNPLEVKPSLKEPQAQLSGPQKTTIGILSVKVCSVSAIVARA